MPTGPTGATGPTSWDNPGGKYFAEDWVANTATSGTGYGATGPSSSTGSTGSIVNPDNETVAPLILAERESYISLILGTGGSGDVVFGAEFVESAPTGPAGPTGAVPTGPVGPCLLYTSPSPRD